MQRLQYLQPAWQDGTVEDMMVARTRNKAAAKCTNLVVYTLMDAMNSRILLLFCFRREMIKNVCIEYR